MGSAPASMAAEARERARAIAPAVLVGLTFYVCASPLLEINLTRLGWTLELVVIAAIPPQIVLGAFIFFSPRELYPVYSICGRAFTWLSPMRDQQIGGLLVWIPGSMMSVIGALIALRHWMRLSGRARLRDKHAAPVKAASTVNSHPSPAGQP